MSIAQLLGQWLGIVVLASMIGAVGFGALQLALSVRDYFRRRDFEREWLERSANAALPAPRSLPPLELIVASPPCESFRRGTYAAVARQGGKTEELRRQLDRYAGRGGVVFLNGRPYMTVKGAETALVHRYSTPEEVMLLAFKHGGEGEIAIGARLDFERYIIDGERPSLIEPRGIFS